MKERTYIAIDLKSFYASVECVERGLDPLNTNLVVADESRTQKTICLAVSPALKNFGIPGRPRLFEVVEKVNEINFCRRNKLYKHEFIGKSIYFNELKNNPSLSLDYVVAVPRMALYVKYSTEIYSVYTKYISPDDIQVYSIDEVFIDATDYLKIYNLTARDLAMKLIKEVLEKTGVTATAGIGPNLYLCKIAMDIVAKHIQPDKDGVRIAQLDEMSYRRLLWDHKPLTDFWRVGKGYSEKLIKHGLYTMGDVARCSLGESEDYHNEKLLYDLFGVNAELLIDHAWGWEPTTIAQIKKYKPKNKSLCSGQVLHEPYPYDKAKLVALEMADELSLTLVDKELKTNLIVLTVGYDSENLNNSVKLNNYKGEIKSDGYGRYIPKHAHGTKRLEKMTSSTKIIDNAVLELFEEYVDKKLTIRRINITVDNLLPESYKEGEEIQQLNLFDSINKEKNENENIILEKEHRCQKAVVHIKKKFGKNSIMKGMNFEEGATMIDRNGQIGGHKA